MGMFDELMCDYPLHCPGAVGVVFQTKDTPAQMGDLYQIRRDGTLWHEEYDIEDRRYTNENGALSLCGAMTPINKRWVPEPFTGTIRFYGSTLTHGKWIEFAATFEGGQLRRVKRTYNEMLLL